MQPTVPSTDEIRDILVRRIDQQQQAVGIVAGVIEPEGRRVVAYGHLAKDDPRTLDGNTIFEIGSISKVFTSLALADMVYRNEVGLNDRAAKYLPARVVVPERSRAITLHDLSTHTSGLPRLPSNLKIKDPHNPYADYGVDDLYEFLTGYTLPRDSGTEFEYSNLGGGLLGHLLAAHVRTDYENLIRTRITQPLGMPDTGITLSALMTQRMATGHNAMLVPVANWDLPALAGAGALRSSTKDMLTFVEAFLGYRESPLMAAMKATLEVRRPAGQAEVGLGWLIFRSHGRDIAWHNGGTGGFRAFVGCDPQARTGVVVLSNGCGVDDVGFHLLNPELPLANPEAPKPHAEIEIDSTLLENYTGRYQVTASLVLEISRNGNRLFARALVQLPHSRLGDFTGGPKFELFAETEKRFFAKVADNQITFETAADGRAIGLALHRAGRDMPGVRLA
jgi:D-alanyl-D-alanine-carboxypeptidase/D-alanyl-D-alanine-endopeptidase